ncbi:MAG: ABC transporter substrate-binding protein [Thermodesulfovibrionales bacterium]
MKRINHATLESREQKGRKHIWMVIKLCIIFLVFSTLTLHSAEAIAQKKIGFLLFNEQPRYIENKNGVINLLKQKGFGEPMVKFRIENAGGNKAKAAELARKFVAEKMDIVIPIGTSAAVAAANEIKNIPIVFVMVWDPVESKIAEGWKSSNNNTTGASSKTSASRLLKVMKELAGVKRVAVLYTMGERNSEIQVKEFEAEQDNFNIKVVRVPLSNKEAVASVLTEVVRSVDAICLTGSSVVGESLPTIVNIATKAKVITASQSEDHVERGALLGITVDAYAIGRLAGEKAVKILKGVKPSSIPVEPLKKMDLIINMKTAKAGQFQIPRSFMKSVTRVIE